MHEANYPELTRTITQSLAPLRRSQEATMAGFGAMSKAAMAPGDLSEKHKELIALGGGGPSLMYAAEALQAWEQFGA